MNVTLPQNSQGKGVAAVVPAAPFQVLVCTQTRPHTMVATQPKGQEGLLFPVT